MGCDGKINAGWSAMLAAWPAPITKCRMLFRFVRPDVGVAEVDGAVVVAVNVAVPGDVVLGLCLRRV